jgi:hypothetical protein
MVHASHLFSRDHSNSAQLRARSSRRLFYGHLAQQFDKPSDDSEPFGIPEQTLCNSLASSPHRFGRAPQRQRASLLVVTDL